MTTLRLVIALGLAGIVGILWAQYRQIELQRDVIAAQAQVTTQLQAGLAAIQQAGERSRAQMAELLQAQQRVQANLSARTAEIRRLQNDVQEVRDWAREPLPTDIRRLLNTPAATGADDYGEPVRPGHPMHDAGDQPGDERGSTARD